MQVENTRSLNGTLRELLTGYDPNKEYLNIDGIEKTLRNEVGDKEFRIPAADGGGELTFNNRELLSRFASLPIDWQKKFLACIRKAMHQEQVNDIHLVVEWSSGGKRTIKIRQDSSVGSSAEKSAIYGQGDLNFY